MSSLAIASVAFACILAGTLAGMLLGRVLPGHHLSGDSKDAVKQGLGLIATLTALVLGLLVATTKGTFDTQSAAVNDLAANVVLLDRVLERYGPEDTKPIRELLAEYLKATLAQMWPDCSSQPANVTTANMRAAGEGVFEKIAALDPKTDSKRALLKSRALEITLSLGQMGQRLLAQNDSSIPLPFLLGLGFWLTILFGCYGLLAPRNLTLFVILIVCMLSVSATLFLVLQMDRPFDGIVQVFDAPLRAAFSWLGEQ